MLHTVSLSSPIKGIPANLMFDNIRQFEHYVQFLTDEQVFENFYHIEKHIAHKYGQNWSVRVTALVNPKGIFTLYPDHISECVKFYFEAIEYGLQLTKMWSFSLFANMLEEPEKIISFFGHIPVGYRNQFYEECVREVLRINHTKVYTSMAAIDTRLREQFTDICGIPEFQVKTCNVIFIDSDYASVFDDTEIIQVDADREIFSGCTAVRDNEQNQVLASMTAQPMTNPYAFVVRKAGDVYWAFVGKSYSRFSWKFYL